MRWTIYCHTHSASGRRYIGQTKNSMERRWQGHLSSAKRNTRGWGFFVNAIRKYGVDAFTHQVLEVCDTQEQANEAESAWIEAFSTCDRRFGFNVLRHKKERPRSNAPLDRQKRSQQQKANWAKPDFREKVLKGLSTPENKAIQSRTAKSLPHIVAQAAQTHCHKGHEFTPENTRLNLKGSRICKTCKNTRERARYQPSTATLKTACKNGHEFTPENIWWRGNNRCCRACNRENQRKRNQRLKTP